MRVATEANARTTEAARTSLPQALKVSFGGGTVMGLGVAISSFRLEFIFYDFHEYVHDRWWQFLQ